jgi:hypothetical protein
LSNLTIKAEEKVAGGGVEMTKEDSGGFEFMGQKGEPMEILVS